MADELPVCDVLCEAMEYLTKLGSNLRSRSESLKEKKISKDKLRNSHAVQKAAKKVLLICELSKKSLENVESGVKNVLRLVDAAQSTSTGGKSPNSHKTPSTHKKNVIVSGKRYKLKLPQNISLKHYTSVKVFAKSLPKTMIKKYPVYLDCILYRSRQRRLCHTQEEEKATEDQVDQASDLEKIDSEIADSNGMQKLADSDDRNNLANSEEVTEVSESLSKDIDNVTKDSNSVTEDLDSVSKDSNNLIKDLDNLTKDLDILTKNSDTLTKDSDNLTEDSNNLIKDSDTLTKDSDNLTEDSNNLTKYSDAITKDNTDNEEKENIDDSKTNESLKESVETDLKKKSRETKLKSSKSNNKKVSNEDTHKKDFESNKKYRGENVEKSCSPRKQDKHKKKYKKLRIMDDSSDSEKEETHENTTNKADKNVSVIDLDSDQGDQSDQITSEEKTKEENATKSDLEKEKQKQVVEENLSDQSQDSNCAPTKPLIKCVNINKLLKPDAVVKEIPKQVVHLANDGRVVSKTLSQEMPLKSALEVPIKSALKNDVKKNTLLMDKLFHKITPKKVRYEDDENLKRKEVEDFKPKEFVINVLRLPQLSTEFLVKHNLKKISKSGDVILEVQNESKDNEISETNSTENVSSQKSCRESEVLLEKENSSHTPTADEAKNALLNDSDGEKSETPVTLAPETENIKNSLLNSSESDNNGDKDEVTNKDQDAPAVTEPVEHSNNNIADNSSLEKYTEELQSEIEKLSNSTTPVPSESVDQRDKELAKSSLLNDSSGSSHKDSQEKKKRRDSTTPSRRKHIMESMHAKKMLLTYSSSSDTEDEQLKNVIKEIKASLLEGIGPDEEEAKNRVKKKLLSSSDSDEDILHRAKKKRKIAKDKSSSVEDDEKAVDEKGNDSEKQKSDAEHSDTGNVTTKSSLSKMGRSREKPGGSSSPNSDAHDKDIEGLSNLKSLNSKSRRRQDSDSDKADSSSKKEKLKSLSIVTGEGLLEAPSSSEEGSGAESEAVEEDLPTVSLSGLNGGGIEHLAKDDLLEDSESDSSKDKSSEDVKKEDAENDSEAENVKATRRKGNTISSDSEAGSSRKKAIARDTDFEDSEEENSEPVKRGKRKIKALDSDASGGSSSDEGKKKRRRIKQINDSDVSGSDTENEGKSKHGRKNIRKVMGKNQLEEATKKAARMEKERLARIAERQKTYNNLEFDESGKPDEVILDKVVLDFDPETKEPLIEVDRGLVKKLKPHQANGIKFMWDACFESVKRIKKDKGSGCILAHCMGLGKTLQVVSLTHTLLTHSDLTRVNRVLVVCPLSTVLNWVNEFRMWLKHAETDFEVDVYELSRFKQNSERAFQLSQWYEHGGVCVLGYEMFRNLSADNVKKFKKKMLRQFQESLVDPGPDLVVCDEGHLLKNEKTSLSQSMNRVKTLRRIVLTGTPLQNNLKEYYCMVQFVKPNLLGKYNEYLNRFVNPITNGQYTDSTEHDIRVMKRRSHVLHKMLDGAVQRRDYGVLAPFLPPKHEYVLFITLTEVQIKLYQHYLDNYSRRPLPGKSSGFLFPDFQSLQRIWTHPLVLKYNSERYEIMQQKKREREEEDSEGSLVDFIDDDSTPDESSTEESSDDLSDVSDDSRKKKKKKSPKKGKTKESKASTRRGTRANPVEMVEEMPDPEILEVKNENPTEWWMRLVEEEELDDLRNSHKLVLLFEILRQCEAIGDKLLVFSQSLYSLDLIEHFLGKVDEATQEGRIDEKLGGHVGSWSPGVDYFRLDGSTSCENRSIWCKNFNREDNPRARLFLISTRAGGLGINLVAANRVVIFDVSWNPSHDVQSIFRVYRFGQKKPCYIYRFLAMGTMEEKIYERQVTKQAISKRVIDEQQIDRHYAENDLAELYKFEPRPPAPRPVPLVPKDRFFAEMLKEHEAVIYKFHEHDSLLENKEEETLSEEERKAAWEDFENEKNRPPPAPFPAWPMHNGMVPNLLAQQQQQLAYAALAQMLRKDMPNLSDENIRNMLPIIYGSNPGMFGGYDYGLMQKLSDMYKYAQPGMMNPAMMNPVMNAAGATGGMGGGGTSGLQYEPPWQRQQQQQQQMRLQQLMQQQQNQMGAKFYAGGLGSRDPVAMALQQQRAREIMLGGGSAPGGAGRPRGRPPLAPRLPTAAPGDVVNLDSD